MAKARRLVWLADAGGFSFYKSDDSQDCNPIWNICPVREPAPVAGFRRRQFVEEMVGVKFPKICEVEL
jgi:hypothetical protein